MTTPIPGGSVTPAVVEPLRLSADAEGSKAHGHQPGRLSAGRAPRRSFENGAESLDFFI